MVFGLKDGDDLKVYGGDIEPGVILNPVCVLYPIHSGKQKEGQHTSFFSFFPVQHEHVPWMHRHKIQYPVVGYDM